MNEQQRFEARTRGNHDGIPGMVAAPQEVGFSAEGLERISPTVQKFIDDEPLTGAVSIVARRGKVAHFEAYGMMDLAAKKPMQKDAIFRIYSMTKPVAAVAVMMLCEEGKLELDAPAAEYLPQFNGMKVAQDPDAEAVARVAASRDMTVRDLMRHTAGLPGANRYMAGQTAMGRGRIRCKSGHPYSEYRQTGPTRGVVRKRLLRFSCLLTCQGQLAHRPLSPRAPSIQRGV